MIVTPTQTLGGVAHLADVDHGLEAQRAREVRLRLAARGVDLLDGLAERVERGLEGRDLGQLGRLGGGQHVLVDHVDHALGLDVDGADVVVEEDLLTRRAPAESKN